MRLALLLGLGLCFAGPVVAQTTVPITPLPYQQYTDTSFCAAPDNCIFYGAKLGLINDGASTQAPQYYFGVEINNASQSVVPCDVTEMIGVNANQNCTTGGTCSVMEGVRHSVNVSNGSTATSVAHFLAFEDNEGAGANGTILSSVFLTYLPDADDAEKTTLLCQDPAAKIKNAGPARFGATGDPATGYDLDIQGPALLNGNVQILASPTSSPTATAATPTPTATISPTPTVTSTAASPTPTGATASPTPSITPTPPLLNSGIADSGCHKRSFHVQQNAGPNTYCGDALCNVNQQTRILVPVPSLVQGLICTSLTDAAWNAQFLFEFEKTTESSCVAATDGALHACTWRTEAGANACLLTGSTRVNETVCRPGAQGVTYRAAPLHVDANESYHIAWRRAGVWAFAFADCQWLECPLGAER